MTCTRQFGSNWQRKMWVNNNLHWRARYDPDLFDPEAVNPSTGDGSIVIEYISEATLDDGGAWTENEDARIYMTDYDNGLVYMADFSIRGEENGVPTTIIFASGSKVYVAESDQSNTTTWSWENITAIFDDAGSSFTHVNLASNRDLQPILWATVVDTIGSDNTIVVRNQDTSLDITSWNSSTTISTETNDDILGNTVRSMAGAGVGKKDMIFAWKEAGTIYSRYYDSPAWDDIETVATSCTTSAANCDLEHYIDADDKKAAIVYTLSDNSVQFRTRGIGATGIWSATTELSAAGATVYIGLCLVIHPEDIHAVYCEQHTDTINFKVYNIAEETWGDAKTWSSDTDAIDGTDTVYQLQTTSALLAQHHMVINWIGGDDCTIGFGILVEAEAGDCSPSQSTLIVAILAKIKLLTDYEVFFKAGPQNESLPYVTFDIISDVIDWKSLENDFFKVGLQVNVWGRAKTNILALNTVNDAIHEGLNRWNLSIYCDDFLVYSNKYIFTTTSRGQCDVDNEYIHVWSEYDINLLSS